MLAVLRSLMSLLDVAVAYVRCRSGFDAGQHAQQRRHRWQEIGDARGSCAQHHQRETTGTDVLLILQVPIDGDQDFEPGFFRASEQRAVLRPGPAECLHSADLVPRYGSGDVERHGFIA